MAPAQGDEPGPAEQAPDRTDRAPVPPAETGPDIFSSRRLDDLIPDSALDNPQDWAAQGVTQQTPPPPPPLEEAGDLIAPAPVLALPEDVPVPEPLEPDPQLAELDPIDAPDLVDLPELEEYRISDELILAFPIDNDRFPERTDFIERYKALSTIEALDGDEEETVPQLAARARADEELLSEILRVYGYYSAEVIRQLSGGRRGMNGNGDTSPETGDAASDPRVRFDILPGPLYRFGAVDLGRLGDLERDDAEDIVASFAINPGDPLYADRIPAAITELRILLGDSGYPFVEIDEPSLLIDHARLEGDLAVPVSPGGQYVFGEVISDDPRFLSGRHLETIARFEEGDAYQASLQADLRRAVLATGLVSSVAITPREVAPPQGDEPGTVALDVALERAPLRTVSGALGYGTEEGFRIEAGWEHRNLFPPEGALRLRGILGTQEQLASVSFQRSNFMGRDQILTLDAYASDLDTDAIDARTLAVRGTFAKVSNLLFQKPLSWQVGAEVLYTNERNSTFFETRQPRQEYLIAGLFGRATLDGSNDLLDPSRGFRLTGILAADVSRTRGEVSTYVRTGVDAITYQPIGDHVFAGRAHVQTIVGASVFDIAPSRRLYAGGGGSVRGYAFQAIGPRDEFGNPIGGRSLVELSAEARIQTGFLDGAIEVVPFIDAGTVSTGTTPDFGVIRVGAGIGIRYKTSFGPIRVDVGVPLNPDEFDSPVAVYVSLGQAF
ncbi:MAG: BamA/TamA family outer membrane protein [Erythrobacter sp.]|nr:BamA/TamA family outer membrane protein [Erythrobacter sp.]